MALVTATTDPARPFAAPWQGPKPRRRSILAVVLAKTRAASLNLLSRVHPIRAYALPVGGMACFAIGAFTLAAWAGWITVGAGMLVLDWYRDRA